MVVIRFCRSAGRPVREVTHYSVVGKLHARKNFSLSLSLSLCVLRATVIDFWRRARAFGPRGALDAEKHQRIINRLLPLPLRPPLLLLGSTRMLNGF